jgi:hypothetical protein
MNYLLDDEKILERKNISLTEMSGICDYNVLISFYSKDNIHSVPDDIFCSNPKISKYRKGCLSSRIIDKLYDLSDDTSDTASCQRREEIKDELLQIKKFFVKYSEEDDDIPLFLMRDKE